MGELQQINKNRYQLNTDNLDHLFGAIPSIQSDYKSNKAISSNTNIEDEEKKVMLEDVDDGNLWLSDESNLNFMNPFSSKLSYSNETSKSLNTSFDEAMDDDINFMGVGGHNLPYFHASHPKSSNVSNAYCDPLTVQKISQFREEWNGIKE